jgi:NitT/TauT family transport system substrate-binding protein
VLALLVGLGGQEAAAETPLRHLVVALPAGLSPRTTGFFLAQQEGYFRDRGLQVDFITSASRTPSQMLADGKADLAVDLMPVALRLRQDGASIQHVAQFFQHGSLALYCRPPITKPADLHGTTIGVWFGGEESAFYGWMTSLNISTFGEEDGVTVLRQGRVSEALADARLDCVTSTSYLAPLEMQSSGISPTSRTVFRYEDLGMATLEDGLYARTPDLQNKDRLGQFAQFLAAAIRGWQKLHDDRASALRLFHYRDGLAADQSDLTAAEQPGAAAVPASQTTASTAAVSGKKPTVKAHTTDKPDKDDASVAVETTHQAILVAGASGADTPAAAKPVVSAMVAEGANPAALKASLDAVDAAIDPTHFAIGQLDTQSYDRTVNLLLTGAPEPILKGAPVDALSNLVWKRLRQDGGLAKP